MSFHRVITGDCSSVIPTITERIHAVVTDPPYGVEWMGHSASTRAWRGLENDTGSLDIRGLLCMECPVVSFGANCYPDQLPHRGRWLCWDKRVDPNADAMLGSPFELAWCNATSGFDKIYRIMHGGVVNADGRERRVHPTQKPVQLMCRILEDWTPDGATILDPFCGSGTTGVACKLTGRNFIGIEIDEGYANIARRRIADAASLFHQPEREADPLLIGAKP